MIQLNKFDKQDLSHTFLTAIRQFYLDPRNVERFEKWKKGRERDGIKNEARSQEPVQLSSVEAV